LRHKVAKARTNRGGAATHNLTGHLAAEVPVSDSKVVPFRRRRASQPQLEAYQRMTRHLSPTLRQKLSPEQRARLLDKDPRAPGR